FSAFKLCLHISDVGLGALNVSFRAFEFRDHLGHVNLGDQLAFAHSVADINFDPFQVTGGLRVESCLLEGLNACGHRYLARYLVALGRSDLNTHRFGDFRWASVFGGRSSSQLSPQNERGDEGDDACSYPQTFWLVADKNPFHTFTTLK